MPSDELKGTSLWKNVMLLSGYVFMIAMMFMLMLNARIMLIPTLVVFGIWMIVAWNAQREVKIRVLRKYGGKKIITGTLDEEEDMGELIELQVERIVPYDALTKDEKVRVQKLIELETALLTELDRKDNIRYVLEKKVKEDNRIKEITNQENTNQED